VRKLVFFLLFSSLALRPAGAATISLNNFRQSAQEVPQWEPLILDFEIQGLPEEINPYWPYDPQRPAGFESLPQGVTVMAEFSPDDWRTVYRQPAFWFQPMAREEIDDREWLYPQGEAHWQVRFTPNRLGSWRYRLWLEFSQGRWDLRQGNFRVTQPQAGVHGFLRVSPTDRRFFEFSDGTLWWGLGHQDSIDLRNSFRMERKMADYREKGLNFLRMWMTGTGIFGAAWQPWLTNPQMSYQNQWPRAGQVREPTWNNHLWSYKVDTSANPGHGFNPCPRLAAPGRFPSVKPNTEYELEIRLRSENITGPADASHPWGFTVKQMRRCPRGNRANWDSNPLFLPYIRGTHDWQIYRARFTTKNQHDLRNLSLKLENTTGGRVWVDYITIREVLPNGELGPNVVPKGDFNVQNYYDPFIAYIWDKVIESAQENKIFLKLVVLEKWDPVFRCLNDQGEKVCDPLAPEGTPEDNFHGIGRVRPEYPDQDTLVRRLHKYWWYYLKARWGYARAIHSWELLNEGNRGRWRHFNQAEALARYLNQFGSEPQMVTTSFANGFPLQRFWGKADFQTLSYYDIHARPHNSLCYPNQRDPISGQLVSEDAALLHLSLGRCLYQGGCPCAPEGGINGWLNNHPEIGRKPLVRGETDLTCSQETLCSGLDQDEQGYWLHNFVWAQVQPNTTYELLWYQRDLNQHQLRAEFGRFRRFIADLPLHSGYWRDAQAQIQGNQNLRVLGQKDPVNRGLVLWIQDLSTTWRRQVEGTAINALRGQIIVEGYPARANLTGQIWSPWQGEAIGTVNFAANSQGRIIIDLDQLRRQFGDRVIRGDLAIKVIPTQGMRRVNPDFNRDGQINRTDRRQLLRKFSFPPDHDVFPDGQANSLDFGLIILSS